MYLIEEKNFIGFSMIVCISFSTAFVLEISNILIFLHIKSEPKKLIIIYFVHNRTTVYIKSD